MKKGLVKQLNRFLFGLIRLAAFVSIAYLANLAVAEWFGGVNPLLEFSTSGISKIESDDSKNQAGLGLAFQACKDDLDGSLTYEFPDASYDAWNLSDGRFLIESRIYTTVRAGSSVPANLLCRVIKTEDNEYLATRWQVQGIQISLL